MTSCSLTRIRGLLRVRVANEEYRSSYRSFEVSPSISLLSCETGRHHGKIARELGVVAILRAPLIELRHRLRHREAGLPLAGRILPGAQQALIQLTHVLQQEALGFRPLSGHHACRGAVL